MQQPSQILVKIDILRAEINSTKRQETVKKLFKNSRKFFTICNVPNMTLCVKSPNADQKNADQKNSVFGHFSHSGLLYVMLQTNFYLYFYIIL